ncbi:mannitol-1-phosphate 5-dehydrogenase [Terrilactibacillus sp. BCM23-1]|uniref:Mannitol-1-phosphate 5-dehydrogenase n=1 Tax=Terrilactibacillus tamarindi TaxID=2599694 RepID=A0A6N8CQA9_9BACI|nr:mannitol-1-phosphate 5-dehydrogenase [Terrilactibacillus tamarindi]MTT32389.1 mannitol-1-phosphate 5-dehydrogenase [Terrilactibacillus tamarindi]
MNALHHELSGSRDSQPHRPNAVHFGAGNIGRGFIGLLLTKSNYDVCFVTRNKKKISLLKQRKQYPVYIANQTNDKQLVQNVTAISTKNKAAVARRIANTNLVTTAVGVSNLPNIADKIALGIRQRLQNNCIEPLHIIACENALAASSKLKKYVYEHIPEDLHEKVDRYVSFPNAAVDRIVPLQHHEDPLAVTVEPYFEWVIDRSAMLGGLPEIQGVKMVDSLEAFIERKLFTVNTGHCCAAYLGYLNGYTTIQEVMADPRLTMEIEKVMQETGNMLIEKHDLDEPKHKIYIKKILKRFKNPNLTDKIVRVGRSPIRKLSLNDRLVKPALLSHDLGLDASNLTKAIAAGLLFDYPKDPEAKQLKQAIRKNGVHHVINKYLGIPHSHPIHQKIVNRYNEFNEKFRLVKEA